MLKSLARDKTKTTVIARKLKRSIQATLSEGVKTRRDVRSADKEEGA
jgi:hypothetical protein